MMKRITDSPRYQWGDIVTFTNEWGQENQRATVMWQDNDTLTVDYLNCQHEIPVSCVKLESRD